VQLFRCAGQGKPVGDRPAQAAIPSVFAGASLLAKGAGADFLREQLTGLVAIQSVRIFQRVLPQAATPLVTRAAAMVRLA
jgi:hypothetical protein